MGYSASACGTAVFEKSVCIDEILKTLGEAFDDAFLEKELDDGAYEVSVSNNEKFDIDYALEVLEQLNKVTLDGEIHVEGEEGSRWRYRFIVEYGGWVEESCHSVFEEYNKERNIYEVPVYILTRIDLRTDSVGKIEDAFIDRRKAEAECGKKNAERRDKNTKYRVVRKAMTM